MPMGNYASAGDVADAMSQAARELMLYCENEPALYRQQCQIDRNMARRYVADTFNLDLGIKAYTSLANQAAKDYHREHGTMADKWSDIFPTSDRKMVAEYFARSFVQDLRGYVLHDVQDLTEDARKVVDKARASGWRAWWER